jgi:zinc protease
MQQTEGGTFDPQRFAAIGSIARDYGTTTPLELQALAVKYLAPQKDWSMVVMPEANREQRRQWRAEIACRPGL